MRAIASATWTGIRRQGLRGGELVPKKGHEWNGKVEFLGSKTHVFLRPIVASIFGVFAYIFAKPKPKLASNSKLFLASKSGHFLSFFQVSRCELWEMSPSLAGVVRRTKEGGNLMSDILMEGCCWSRQAATWKVESVHSVRLCCFNMQKQNAGLRATARWDDWTRNYFGSCVTLGGGGLVLTVGQGLFVASWWLTCF